MYAHNYGTGSHAYVTPQGYAPSPAYGTIPGYASNSTYAPSPSYATVPPTGPAISLAPAPVPVPTQTQIRTHSRTPTPTAPVLNPIQVPPGCYPIELVQFWRDECKRDQPYPLHWALFVRTAPPTITTHGSGQVHARPRHLPTMATPRGNFYELVGTPDTYTVQFLPSVTSEPETLADWRGTHVIGWVSPGQLHVFERVVRQVQVWRHRPDWRCQQWVYDVVRAVGGSFQGLFMDGVTLGGLQKHMGRLLEAWESGDI